MAHDIGRHSAHISIALTYRWIYSGDFGTVLGLDYFGVSNELGTSTLSVPLRLYRGEPGGGASDS